MKRVLAWFSYVGKIPGDRAFCCFATVPDFADLWKHESPIIWDGWGQTGKIGSVSIFRFYFCDNRPFFRHIGKIWDGKETAKSPIVFSLTYENQVYRAIFNWVSKVISRLLWFCIATLCDWLKNFAPLSQPIRSKTKTNRDLLTRVFPCLAPATCIYFEF